MVYLHGRTGLRAACETNRPASVRVGQRAGDDLAFRVLLYVRHVAFENRVACGGRSAAVRRPAAELLFAVVAALSCFRGCDGVRRIQSGLPVVVSGRGLTVRLRGRIVGLIVRLRGRIVGLTVRLRGRGVRLAA